MCGWLETAGNNIGLRYTIEILKNYIVDSYVEIPCNLNDLYKYGWLYEFNLCMLF